MKRIRKGALGAVLIAAGTIPAFLGMAKPARSASLSVVVTGSSSTMPTDENAYCVLTLSCQSAQVSTPPSGNPINPNPSNPNTINAASCSRHDVSAALSSIVADNTTVNIPAGTCAWSTRLTYVQKHSFILQGAGAQSAGAYGVNG